MEELILPTPDVRRDAAVVLCADQRFARLLEFELGLCGMTVLFSGQAQALPPSASCGLWLVDLDAYSFEELPTRPDGCVILGWSRDPETVSCQAYVATGMLTLLRRPFALTALEQEIKKLTRGEACEDSSTPWPSVGLPLPEPVAEKKKETENAALLVPLAERVVAVGEQQVMLTHHEWVLFTCLWNRRGETVPKESLRALLSCGEKSQTETNTLEVYICHLRSKLEKPIGRRLITTVRSKGYRLDIEG